jgi:hypothetical protein
MSRHPLHKVTYMRCAPGPYLLPPLSSCRVIRRFFFVFHHLSYMGEFDAELRLGNARDDGR